MSELDLKAVRARIDQLDIQIQELVSQRAELAEEVARAKYALEPNPSFYRPEREAEVLRMALERNRGRLPEAFVSRLFREVMSMCLSLQKPLRVAYLGPQGTYSQAAALKQFGHAIQQQPQPTIDEVFREVEAGNADFGLVPVENSTEGGVNQTLDLLVRSPLKICGEVELPIHHHLLSRADSLAQVRRVYSHQQSLAQCRLWLDTHLPNIERVAVNSNAEAARRAAEEPDSAAIAGQAAGELYQLPSLVARIEDELTNTTRFAVLGNQDVPATGKDKTSILFSTPNQPGALYRMLAPLAHYNLSMTRIESRPSRQRTWAYVFFVDLIGHTEDAPLRQALAELEQHSSLFKLLGAYPRAQ